MNILIVDDLSETCNYISNIITGKYNNMNCYCVHSYDDAITILDSRIFDVIILDYELEKNNESKNGLTLGKYISALNSYKNVPIIFETNYPEHIYTVVNTLNCVYYLLKPFFDDDIINMMDKIFHIIPNEPKLSFHNSVGISSLIKINDIHCIQSSHHDIIVYTYSDRYNFINYSLSDIEKDSSGKLIRCHKSYIINPEHITSIDKSNNIISILNTNNILNIPIGRKYSAKIYDYCNKGIIL